MGCTGLGDTEEADGRNQGGATEFPGANIFTFPTVDVCRERWPGIDKMATLLNLLFFVFKTSFLPKYGVKYYDYNCKVVQWEIV